MLVKSNVIGGQNKCERLVKWSAISQHVLWAAVHMTLCLFGSLVFDRAQSYLRI